MTTSSWDHIRGGQVGLNRLVSRLILGQHREIRQQLPFVGNSKIFAGVKTMSGIGEKRKGQP